MKGFRRAPFKFKPYGNRFRVGQYRSIDWSKVHLKTDAKGKDFEIKHDRSSRLNYDASKKYPYSSLRQQTRELRRMFLPVDINFWEFEDAGEIRTEEV